MGPSIETVRGVGYALRPEAPHGRHPREHSLAPCRPAMGSASILTLIDRQSLLVWWQMGEALRGSLETTLQTRADGILTHIRE